MPKVDAIIPYFNTPIEFARAAVGSVLSQTFTDLRCVVVNDGSAAGFTAELEELLQGFHDDRILYVKTPNGGAAAARNAGIRASDAPYIALLDSDDAWRSAKLQWEVPLLDRSPEVALIHGCHEILNAGGELLSTSSKAYLNKLSQREQLRNMLLENFVSVGTTLFRRSCAEAVGLFDESFRNIEDKDFFLRLLLHGYQFVSLDEVVTTYRAHAGNKSGNPERMLLARRRLIDKVARLVFERPDLSWLGWNDLREKMEVHALQEASEKYWERREYLLALSYKIRLPSSPWGLRRQSVGSLIAKRGQ